MLTKFFLNNIHHSRRVEMKLRKFGKLDWQVSALGFGAMRLPTVGDDHSKVDEPEEA